MATYESSLEIVEYTQLPILLTSQCSLRNRLAMFNGSVAVGNCWFAIQWGLPWGTALCLLTTECEFGFKSTTRIWVLGNMNTGPVSLWEYCAFANLMLSAQVWKPLYPPALQRPGGLRLSLVQICSPRPYALLFWGLWALGPVAIRHMPLFPFP